MQQLQPHVEALCSKTLKNKIALKLQPPFLSNYGYELWGCGTDSVASVYYRIQLQQKLDVGKLGAGHLGKGSAMKAVSPDAI